MSEITMKSWEAASFRRARIRLQYTDQGREYG